MALGSLAALLASAPLRADGPAAAEPPPGVRPDAAAARAATTLCAQGAPIARIEVERLPIFDVEGVRRGAWFYRTANAIHRPMSTRSRTVRALLSLEPGDLCSVVAVEEAERLLRSLPFLQDAWVLPAAVEALPASGEAPGEAATEAPEKGIVLRVIVRDAWSTRVGASYRNEGGARETRFRVIETNLLGSGTRLELSWEKDQDRREKLLRYDTPTLFGSPWRAAAVFADNSDGKEEGLRVFRPFWSLDERWSISAGVHRFEREEKVYVGSRRVDTWQGDTRSAEFAVAFSPRGLEGDRLFRWGAFAAYERDRWRLADGEPRNDRPDLRPYNHELWLGGLEASWQRVDFRRIERLRTARRVEDLELGRRVSARIAAHLPGTSGDDGGRWSVRYRGGMEVGPEAFLLLSASQSGEWLRGGAYNVETRARLEYLRRLTPRTVVQLLVRSDWGENLEGPRRFLLGGDTGLRGYDTRSFSGSRRLLVRFERRVFTRWELGQLLRVGWVAFAEAGGAWEESDSFGLSQLHPDVGLGLRLFLIPSSGGTTFHLNAAMPLDPNGTDEGRTIRFSFTTESTF